MSRANKLLVNSLTGVTKQIIAIICGFILPRYILLYYGSTLNGLVSSITYYLSFISLLDMGVGAVVQANLYGPLADNDSERISRIVKASKKFFRILALISLVYAAVLAFGLPRIVTSNYDAWFSATLVAIIAASTFVQYFFGMTNQLLLNADQRAYVPLSLSIVTLILNTVLSVILMRSGASIHAVKLATALVFVIRPLGQTVYVRRHYTIDNKVLINEDPIKQKWNGFSQHFAAIVCSNIDVVVLSVLSTLENVSVYSVYYLITNGVQQIVMTAATGLESLFGNMIAKKENENLLKTFSAVEWAVHTGVTVIFTVAAITIVPFVMVYTRGITDANYQRPLFGFILVYAYAVMCLRVPYFRMIKAAGHFKQTQNGAYISAGLNIVITVALVKKFGLVGAAAGTFIALLYHTCYFVYYLKDNIIERAPKHFIKYAFTDAAISALSVVLCRSFAMMSLSYGAWIVLALKTAAVTVAISLTINALFHRRMLKTCTSLLKKHKKS